MSKKRSTRKKTKGLTHGDAIKRLRRQVVGLTVEWDDNDPLTETREPIDGTFTHKNPVMNINARQTFSGMGSWLVNEPFKWDVSIVGVFEYDKIESHEERQMTAFCSINDINDLAMDLIREIRRYGSDEHYKTIKFKLECVGLSE